MKHTWLEMSYAKWMKINNHFILMIICWKIWHTCLVMGRGKGGKLATKKSKFQIFFTKIWKKSPLKKGRVGSLWIV